MVRLLTWLFNESKKGGEKAWQLILSTKQSLVQYSTHNKITGTKVQK